MSEWLYRDIIVGSALRNLIVWYHVIPTTRWWESKIDK